VEQPAREVHSELFRELLAVLLERRATTVAETFRQLRNWPESLDIGCGPDTADSGGRWCRLPDGSSGVAGIEGAR